MQEGTDSQLLLEYVEKGDNEAFAALVGRYVHMVYSTALRKTDNPCAAEEITQTVFIILAKKASGLPRKIILSGWLYQTTRLTAANFLRAEFRRVRREQEAYMESHSNEPESEIWPQIMPLLEDAMGRLGEKDRNALALRFFEGKSFQEIGGAFGASENAAKKRVGYALEKLRKYFSRHGVTSTTATIASAMAIHSVQTAPMALAKAAAALALAKGATAPTSTIALLNGVLKIMAWSKVKTAIIAGAAILITAGTATLTVKEIAAGREQAWQQKPDTSFVDKMAPQVTIVPALRSRAGNIDWWGGRNGKWIGLGVNSTALVQAAYDASLGRLIFSVPPPEGKYDFISNLPKGQAEGLQQEIKKKFGLIGKRTLMETNVLVLELRNRNVPGLNPTSDPTGQNSSRTKDTIQCVYVPMSKLVEFLENALQVPVIDRTGLTGYFDIFVTWDSTPEGLKKAVLKQLGLELVPGRESVEFLVVEKAN
jgi:uncharacterized protein (TIGR03435 family)